MRERAGSLEDSVAFDIDFLREYYKDKGLTIIGLNDSQGVNVNSTFFKKGLLEYISNALKSEELDPTVINAFSLLMNKTEHIDYFLKNNLTVEEIKLSQLYSTVMALRKVFNDIHLPDQLGNIAYINRMLYSVKEEDKNKKITTELQTAIEPTVIYSSGVNNLMREVGNNPFRINSDYKNRNKRPNYDYAIKRASKLSTLNRVIDGMERNFENILSINGNTDIYVLGSYSPKSFESEGMEIFRELMIEYNIRLQDLCRAYDLTYINTEKAGKKYNNSTLNFHVSEKGHIAIANSILEAMYYRKSGFSNITDLVQKEFVITDRGSEGMIEDLEKDIEKSKFAGCVCTRISENEYEMSSIVSKNDEYSEKRKEQIVREHEREKEVFEKVLIKTRSK